MDIQTFEILLLSALIIVTPFMLHTIHKVNK